MFRSSAVVETAFDEYVPLVCWLVEKTTGTLQTSPVRLLGVGGAEDLALGIRLGVFICLSVDAVPTDVLLVLPEEFIHDLGFLKPCLRSLVRHASNCHSRTSAN